MRSLTLALVGTALLELSPATLACKLASSSFAAGGAANALLACRRAGGNERLTALAASATEHGRELADQPDRDPHSRRHWLTIAPERGLDHAGAWITIAPLSGSVLRRR